MTEHILIESQWNLKTFTAMFFPFFPAILIESQWNLKLESAWGKSELTKTY